MRQAGRSLPEYREIRKQHGLFEVCRRPELCAEVTLQPVRRHGVDAAVLFADIITPVLGMGIQVELVEPVVGGEQVVPGSSAGILELDARPADRARLRGIQLVGEPAHAERSGGDGMGGNRLHSSG